METFTHPPVRDAKVWPTGGLQGPSRPVLVVITGIALSSDHPCFKQKSFDRLTDAVKGWIADHPEVACDFILINRPKTWAGDKLD